jgi:SAM-dependent methyltransferase
VGHRFDRLTEVPRRLRSRAERALYPEAQAPADQWQRMVLNQAVDDRIAALGPADLTAAEISGSNHLGKPWKQFTSLDYPEFDLCAPVPESLQFDVVICEQVLEHVVDPFGAARNLRALCVAGGHVIVSTPFLIKVHELPEYEMRDYWRFTPRGMRAMLEGAGLEVEVIGAWGNRNCVVGNLEGWSGYRRWHSLRNEPDVPVQVWAFARNPG